MFRVREKLGKKYRDLRRQMPLASIAELEEHLQAARRDADTDFHQYAKNHPVKDVTGEHPVEAGWEEVENYIQSREEALKEEQVPTPDPPLSLAAHHGHLFF